MSLRMHRAHSLSIPALIGLVIAVGYSSFGSRPDEQSTPPARIATIDLEKVFNSIEQKKAADAEVQKLQTTMAAELKQISDSIRRMEADLTDHLPGSAKYRELEGKLLMDVGEYQAQQEFFNAKFNVERGRHTDRVYQAIRGATGRLASERGIDLVVVDDSVVEMTEGDVDSVTRQISARRVLYANAALNITDELIARMNEEFKSQ